MYNNKLRAIWDQVKGFSRELWGDIIGDEQAFSAVLRQRMIGRLVIYRGMNRDDAEQQTDKILQ
jgi:uncharacterized protein YjbJ (UPF0337 family)